MNLRSDPLSLDPRKTNDAGSINLIKVCFDGLTRMGLDGKAQLSVASHIAISEDQKVYTCTLKETLWSDGTPVTAYDFEQSWKTMLQPAFPCEAVTDLFILKNARAAKFNKCPVDAVGVKALDAQTLRIELDHPLSSFLSMLSTHCFLPTPSHIISKYPDWADKGENYVCNGPFSLQDWRQSNYMTLIKNENYWDKQSVRLEKIQLYIIEDESTGLSMFDGGELDWVGSPLSSLPFDALASLSNVQTYNMAGIYYYTINNKDPLLANVHLRKALALSVNRHQIIENVTQSQQLPAMNFIPPALWTGTQQYFKDADVEQARQHFKIALKELGLTQEEFPVLKLSYNTMNSHHKIAQAIQGQWRDALGIKVSLENKEWKVYLDEQRHHQFQIARMGGLANFLDPITFLDNFRYLSSAENFSQWTNPAFTELLEKADHTIDPEERLCYLFKAESIFMDEMPVIPIYFYTGSYLKKPYVKDLYISELGDVDFKWAYVDMKR
jgi:oligopeptide transport system substrate-binding protein